MIMGTSVGEKREIVVMLAQKFVTKLQTEINHFAEDLERPGNLAEYNFGSLRNQQSIRTRLDAIVGNKEIFFIK